MNLTRLGCTRPTIRRASTRSSGRLVARDLGCSTTPCRINRFVTCFRSPRSFRWWHASRLSSRPAFHLPSVDERMERARGCIYTGSISAVAIETMHVCPFRENSSRTCSTPTSRQGFFFAVPPKETWRWSSVPCGPWWRRLCRVSSGFRLSLASTTTQKCELHTR